VIEKRNAHKIFDLDVDGRMLTGSVWLMIGSNAGLL